MNEVTLGRQTVLKESLRGGGTQVKGCVSKRKLGELEYR